MAKEVRKVPELRFKEFEDGWNQLQISDNFELITTNSFSRNDLNYENGSIKNIHYGDIHTKFSSHLDFAQHNIPFINENINLERYDDSFYCKPGDLLMADASEDLTDIGKTTEIINTKEEKVLSGLHTIHLRPKKSHFYIGFGGFLFQTHNFRRQIQKESQGAKVLGISGRKVLKLRSFIPSLPEQKKIAEFLSRADKRISLLKTKKEQLEEYKKGVMQKIFSCEIRFKKDDGGEFPEWEEKKLGDLGDFKGGGTPSTAVDEYWQGKLPWVSSSDLVENEIRTINVNKYITEKAVNESATQIISKDSILIVSRVGVGKFAVTNFEICTSQDFTNLILDKLKFNLDFTAFNLFHNSHIFKKISQGTSIKGFTTVDLKKVKLFFPSLPEQKKIASFLSAIDNRIALVDGQITQAEEWKRGLLQRMFV